MAKEGYKPTAGMQSAARRAIKLKEQGKAKGSRGLLSTGTLPLSFRCFRPVLSLEVAF